MSSCMVGGAQPHGGASIAIARRICVAREPKATDFGRHDDGGSSGHGGTKSAVNTTCCYDMKITVSFDMLFV